MQQSDTIVMRPIGRVHSTRAMVEDDRWDAVEACIELESSFTPEALVGLDAFSHVEVVFVMDRVDPAKVETEARHPRDNPAWPRVGIFAQRAKWKRSSQCAGRRSHGARAFFGRRYGNPCPSSLRAIADTAIRMPRKTRGCFH